MAGLAGAAGAEERVTVRFVVVAPAATPAADTLWISGDRPELGSWSGTGVRLLPAGGGRHQGAVDLPRGARAEFKVTRGSWETVEKDESGREIANRSLVAGSADSVVIRVGAWRDQVESRRPGATRSGTIRHHAAFASRHVRARDVWVYLPPGYDADTTRRHPVLYFHDGNNVFDAATSFLGVEWEVDEAAERMIRAGEVPPFVVVAVANTPDRIAEYTPVPDRPGGGRAAATARFLIEELMPFVERTYRVGRGPDSTGVVGSSLGGIVSLYLGLEHPEHFGIVGCVSPAAGWADRDIVRRVERAGKALPRQVWLDVGTEESTAGAGRRRWIEDARALRDALVRGGLVEGVSLHYEEVEGARHDERAWAARTPRLLAFLLGPPAARAPRRRD